MLLIISLIMAAIGFVAGSAFGFVLNGDLSDPSSLLRSGLYGAIALVLIQFCLSRPSLPSHSINRSKLGRSRHIRRTESEGTFSDRLERFAANVEQDAKAQAPQSKTPLRMSEDCDDLEPTPPRSVGIIRMLLQRIRKVLTGN